MKGNLATSVKYVGFGPNMYAEAQGVYLTVLLTFDNLLTANDTTETSHRPKMGEGAGSNLVGIICPPVWNSVN